MKTVSKADIEKMQQGGAKVRKKIGSRPARKEKPVVEAAPPPPAEKPIKEIAEVVRSVDKVAQAVVESTKESNKIIQALQKKLIEQPVVQKPVAYRFTINRDSYGYIETVDAVPGGNK